MADRKYKDGSAGISGGAQHWKKAFVKRDVLNLEESEVSSVHISNPYSGIFSVSSDYAREDKFFHYIPNPVTVVNQNQNMDDETKSYQEKRRKNNIAAKKSRDARKKRIAMIETTVHLLEQQNRMLRNELIILRQESQWLHEVIVRQFNINVSSMTTTRATETARENRCDAKV